MITTQLIKDILQSLVLRWSELGSNWKESKYEEGMPELISPIAK